MDVCLQLWTIGKISWVEEDEKKNAFAQFIRGCEIMEGNCNHRHSVEDANWLVDLWWQTDDSEPTNLVNKSAKTLTSDSFTICLWL